MTGACGPLEKKLGKRGRLPHGGGVFRD